MLRIGLMLDSYKTSAWVASIVEEIEQSSFGRISLVVLNTPAKKKPLTLKKRIQNHWKLTFYSRYEQWDYQKNKQSPDLDYRAERDLSSLLAETPKLVVNPQRKGFSDYFSEEAINAIRAAKLDVIFRFGFRIIRGAILETPRFGIWSFHHDDNLKYRGGPPLFWEIFEGDPVSGTILQILTSSLDGGKVIYRGHSATHQRSLYLNRNPIYWKTAQYALRRLHDLDTRGWEYIESLNTYNEQTKITPKIHKTPHAGQMTLFVAKIFFRTLRAATLARLHGGFVQWFLAIRKRSPEAGFGDAFGYRILPTPADRFYADPFLIEREQRTWLFFEDYRYIDKRALICCAEIGSEGELGTPVEVLRRPYHLSYPHVFEHEGEMYMIPETKENRTIELYRARRFPDDWVLEAVLLDGLSAVDATLHRSAGKFWMFAGRSTGKYSTCDELALFFADSLLGPWQPHPNNPIVSDVRRARPAGALFYENGRLIRPSQDCSVSYGYGLCFSEVVVLTETEYEEVPVSRIDPGWAEGNLGTHTYTRSTRFEMIDGNRPIRVS